VRWVVSELSAVADLAPQPWRALYPQRADGVPLLVPSGQHHARLFWMGAWRRIAVDDTRPWDDQCGWHHGPVPQGC
jgi:hypothetical protein